MLNRGHHRSLFVGVLIAVPSGAGVALSVLGGNAASLVGVAISASLLPPGHYSSYFLRWLIFATISYYLHIPYVVIFLAVNCGIFFAIAALHGDDDNYLIGYKLASPSLFSGEDRNYR